MVDLGADLAAGQALVEVVLARADAASLGDCDPLDGSVDALIAAAIERCTVRAARALAGVVTPACHDEMQSTQPDDLRIASIVKSTDPNLQLAPVRGRTCLEIVLKRV